MPTRGVSMRSFPWHQDRGVGLDRTIRIFLKILHFGIIIRAQIVKIITRAWSSRCHCLAICPSFICMHELGGWDQLWSNSGCQQHLYKLTSYLTTITKGCVQYINTVPLPLTQMIIFNQVTLSLVRHNLFVQQPLLFIFKYNLRKEIVIFH